MLRVITYNQPFVLRLSVEVPSFECIVCFGGESYKYFGKMLSEITKKTTIMTKGWYSGPAQLPE